MAPSSLGDLDRNWLYRESLQPVFETNKHKYIVKIRNEKKPTYTHCFQLLAKPTEGSNQKKTFVLAATNSAVYEEPLREGKKTTNIQTPMLTHCVN